MLISIMKNPISKYYYQRSKKLPKQIFIKDVFSYGAIHS